MEIRATARATRLKLKVRRANIPHPPTATPAVILIDHLRRSIIDANFDPLEHHRGGIQGHAQDYTIGGPTLTGTASGRSRTCNSMKIIPAGSESKLRRYCTGDRPGCSTSIRWHRPGKRRKLVLGHRAAPGRRRPRGRFSITTLGTCWQPYVKTTLRSNALQRTADGRCVLTSSVSDLVPFAAGIRATRRMPPDCRWRKKAR